VDSTGKIKIRPAKARSSGGWGWLKAISVCLLILAALAFAGEAFLRLSAPEYGSLNFSLAVTGGHKITYNSHGLRDPERPLKKPPHTQRVIVMGDSISWGYGVGDDQTYLRVVERLWNQSRPQKIEMWNLAGMGCFAGLYLRDFPRLLSYQPDAAIIQINLNDVGDTYQIIGLPGVGDAQARPDQASANEAAPTPKPILPPGIQAAQKASSQPSWLEILVRPKLWGVYLHLWILRTHLGTFLTSQMTQMAYCLGFRQKDPTGRNIHEFMAFLDTPAARTGWRLFLRELTTLTLELRQAKVKVLWVVFPYSYQLGPNRWQVDVSRWPTDPQKRLAEEAQKLGVKLVDLLPAFKSASQKGQSLYVLLDANHPNEQGHAVAGLALYQWLVRLLS